MPEIQFADGFDVTEPLALGLTPAQMVAAVLGLLLDYADLHSDLPRPIALPLAFVVSAVGLALAVGRRDGRTLVEWAGAAIRFGLRSRRGRLLSEADLLTATIDMPRPGSFEPPPSSSLRLPEGSDLPPGHRVPLVLLPRPVEEDGAEPETVPEPAGRPQAEPARVAVSPAVLSLPATADLEVADAAAPPAAAAALSPDTGRPRPCHPVFVGSTRRLTFFSLNGGVGRTTLATEIAALLAGRGRHHDPTTGWSLPLRVALLDLDLRSPCVGLRLGIGQPSISDWLLDGAAVDRLDRHLVRHASGLRALLGPGRLGGPLPAPGQVEEAVHMLERQGAHFIVYDIAAGAGAVNEWVLGNVHDIFVVVTPTPRGIQDAYRSTALLRRMGLRHKLRYVVNRSHAGVELDEAMGDLGGRIDVEIAEDLALAGAEAQHRLVGGKSDGKAAIDLRRLASMIYPVPEGEEEDVVQAACDEPGWRRLARGRRRRAG